MSCVMSYVKRLFAPEFVIQNVYYLILISSWYVSYVISAVSVWLGYLNPIAGAIVGLFVTLVFFYAAMRLTRKMKSLSANPKIKFLKRESSYEVKYPIIIFTKTYLIKALEDDVESLWILHKWSGRGEEKGPEILSPPEAKLHARHGMPLMDFYELYLGKSLQKNETAKIAVKWELSDPDKTAKPWLGMLIDTPCDSALLRVLFSIEDPPKSVKYEAYNAAVQRNPIDIKQIDVINKEAKEEILQPQMHHHYILRWGEL